MRFHLDKTQKWTRNPALLSKSSSDTISTSTSTSSDSNPSTSTSPSIADSNTNDNKAWYKRGDQTMTYFFTMEELKRHVELCSEGKEWEMIGEMVVVSCVVENRKDKLDMQRRFVQGSWKKVMRKKN